MADALITRRGGGSGSEPVNGFLSSFTAVENIKANSFVEFELENSNMEVLLHNVTSFSGTVLGQFISVPITSNTFVVVSGYGYYGVKACVFKINNDGTVTQGTAVTLRTSSRSYTIEISNIIKVKDNLFVVAFRHSETYIAVAAMKINDMTITLLSDVVDVATASSSAADNLALKRVSESNFILTYNLGSSSNVYDLWFAISSDDVVTQHGSPIASSLFPAFLTQVDLNSTTVLRISSSNSAVQIVKFDPVNKTKSEGSNVNLDTNNAPLISNISSRNIENQSMKSESGDRIVLLSTSTSYSTLVDISIDLDSLVPTLLSAKKDAGLVGQGIKFKENELLVWNVGGGTRNSSSVPCFYFFRQEINFIRNITRNQFFQVEGNLSLVGCVLSDGYAYFYGKSLLPTDSSYAINLVRFRKAVKQSTNAILGITKNKAAKDEELEIYTV